MLENNLEINNDITKEEMSLEDSFIKLDEIIQLLEQPDLSLEQSFEAFKSGMDLIKNCNASIDMVEKKVQVITKEGNLDDF